MRADAGQRSFRADLLSHRGATDHGIRARLLVAWAATCGLLSACKPDPQPTQAPDPSPPSLLTTPPTDIESICADSTPRTWRVVSANGEGPVATVRGACLGKETRGFHLVSQYQDADAQRPTLEYHLWLSRDGAPKSAQLRSPTMVRRFFWTPEGLRTSIFGDVEPIDAAADGAWVIARPAPFIEEVALRLGVGVRPDGVEQAFVRAETGELVTDRLGFDGGTDVGVARLESDAQSYVLGGDSLAAVRIERLEYAPWGHLEAVDAEPLAPHLDEIPRPTYAPPEGLEIVPVRIEGKSQVGDPATLGGELVRKVGSEGPQPGVVFFSGSGPQERHGFVPGSSIDVGSHEIHDALAAAGFTVLRYDDRGIGESELGAEATYGYETIVDDARRATAFLANHPDVDASRIVLIGHSEGALTASLLANEKFGKRRRRPAGIVMMAGGGRNLRDVIYSQIRDMVADPDAAEQQVAQTKRIHDAVMNDGEVPAQFEPVRMYFKEIFQHQPVEVVEKLKVPVLVTQGGKDFQVDPELDFEPLRDTVSQLSNTGSTRGSDARLFEDLDHLFKPEPADSSVGHYGDMRRRVDPGFIDAVIAWCSARVGLE